MPMVKCTWCETETASFCAICARPFCREHHGTDDDFCQECSSEETTKLEVQSGSPTTDEEGIVTEHEDVRVLRPVGEFFVTTPGAIANMSDAELERFYNRYTMLVKDCEQALDRHRIVRSMISMESEERQRHKIHVDKYCQPSTKRVAKAVAASSEDKKVEILAAFIKRSGLTKEKLLELINKKRGQTNGKTTGNA